jgi:hypothetical protein
VISVDLLQSATACKPVTYSDDKQVACIMTNARITAVIAGNSWLATSNI